MKNEYDIKTEIYHLLKMSLVATEITGVISKTERPENSSDEDVVISLLSDLPISQMQEVYINVNTYVPDIRRGNQYVEDSLRISHLMNLICDALTGSPCKGYRLEIASCRSYDLPATNEHFINTKILYHYCNS